MRLFAIAFLAGQLIADSLAPSFAHVALAFLVWLVAEERAPRAAPFARGLAAALGGATLVVATTSAPNAECWLPERGEVRKAWLEGEVVASPTSLEDGIRVALGARVAAPELGNACGSVLLTIAEPIDLRPGDRVRAHATLRRPTDFRNPRAYSYARSLAREGIHVTGGARRAALVERPSPPPLAARVDAVRRRIRAAIAAAVREPGAGLLRALVLGEQAVVDRRVRDVLTRAGLAHLLSVSGLHVAAVWGLAFGVFRWLASRSERLLLASDVRALAAVFALGPACFYAVLAGGTVPTERSIAMAALGVAAWVTGREVRPLHVLAVAALVIAIAHPGSPASISFQLSFVAVLALVLVAERASPDRDDESRAGSARRWLLAAVWLSTGVTLATAPLVALHFQRAAPIGILTNPVLVPLLGIPATIVGLAGGACALFSEPIARPLFASAGWLLERLVDGATAAIAVPGASFRVPMPTLFELAIAYGALGLPWTAVEWRRPTAAALVVLALADLGFWFRERSGHGELVVRFLDVGQGDAAFAELPDGRVVVIDGGGLGRGSFDVGERIVAPSLAARKVGRVDVLIATHGDRDHQAGLRYLARELAPRELWLVASAEEERRLEALVTEARAAGATIRRLEAGDRIDDPSGVRFECLHPPRDLVAAPNDRSLVLRLTHGERTFLFAADVEARGEGVMLRDSALAAVDVLKVPHHGSSTSSGEAWLARVHPARAVVSVGAGNPYGAPSETVIRRHRRVGSRVFRTDRDGSVIVWSDGRLVSLRTADEAWPLACSALGLLC